MEKIDAESASVISDPMRLEILNLIHGMTDPDSDAEVPGPAVKEIAEGIDKPTATVSHHLGVLWGAGLVVSERDGKLVRYRLSDKFEYDDDGSAILDIGMATIRISGAAPAPAKRPVGRPASKKPIAKRPGRAAASSR